MTNRIFEITSKKYFRLVEKMHRVSFVSFFPSTDVNIQCCRFRIDASRSASCACTRQQKLTFRQFLIFFLLIRINDVPAHGFVFHFGEHCPWVKRSVRLEHQRWHLFRRIVLYTFDLTPVDFSRRSTSKRRSAIAVLRHRARAPTQHNRAAVSGSLLATVCSRHLFTLRTACLIYLFLFFFSKINFTAQVIFLTVS